MSKKPSEGIGKRLARYRNLSGLSARELAEKAGNGLSRGIIANIESGRKTDVSVDQLIALAAVLAIPPVVLALPVDEPYRFVRLSDGSVRHAMRGVLAMDWFNGMSTIFTDHTSTLNEGEGTAIADALIRAVRQHMILENRVTRLRGLVKEGTISPDAVDETVSELRDLESALARLRVDLTHYLVDDELPVARPAPLGIDEIPAEQQERENWLVDHSISEAAFARFTDLMFESESVRDG